MEVINTEATLKVKHLLWAMGIFQTIIGLLLWFGLWYVSEDIEDAVDPLQTKDAFESWKIQDKANRDTWIENDWKPHIKDAEKTNTNVSILLDRTNSRAGTTNSVGQNGMPAVAPRFNN